MLNPYILVPFAAWATAQLIKFTVKAIQGNLDFRYLYASGGMPSVHSAVVTSLAVTSLIVDGVDSHLFGLTAIIAAIVMYDSFGVRRAAGEQAIALNMLIQSLEKDRIRLKTPETKLREVLGHSPLEVAAGSALGLLLGGLFNLEHLNAQVNWLLSTPVRLEFIVYTVLFGALLLGGAGFKLWVKKKYAKSKSVSSFAKQVLIKTQVIGWMGLVFVFAQMEQLALFSSRLWPLLAVVATVAASLWLFIRYRVSLPEALEMEAEEARKQKWLKKTKKARKTKA